MKEDVLGIIKDHKFDIIEYLKDGDGVGDGSLVSDMEQKLDALIEQVKERFDSTYD